VLDALGIPFSAIAASADLERLEHEMRYAYEHSSIRAAFLQPELWS
jgi:hypothetical protein